MFYVGLEPDREEAPCPDLREPAYGVLVELSSIGPLIGGSAFKMISQIVVCVVSSGLDAG